MKESTARKYAEICDEVLAMMKEKSSRGSPKYNRWYIFDVVGVKHDLTSRTVKNIVWSNQEYQFPAEDSQPTAQ